MKNHAIIVAGGFGTRMGEELPKQFLTILGKPILMHTIEQFAHISGEIVVALPSQYISLWETLCLKYNFTISHKICPGGLQRFFSVKNALNMLPETGAVAIHDGVRPLVTKDFINECFSKLKEFNNVVPFISPKDSLRIRKNNGNQPVDRNSYYLIQTPQCFLLKDIKKAYQTTFNNNFTDDATVAEYCGQKINLVQGIEENIKITTPYDLLIVTAILNKRSGMES